MDKTENLTASQRETLKTEQERAEDIAYTINHSIVCSATDFVDPFIGDFTQKLLDKRISLHALMHPFDSHAHEHHHENESCEPHAHHHHGGLKHWIIGEAVGDVGAVFVTVALQRHAPWMMEALRRVMEPALGPLFHFGASRAAKRWAEEQGFNALSTECREKEAEIYEHEVRHLPQALLWTVSSSALNLATQRLMGNDGPFWHLAIGKLAGAAITAGVVVGGRALVPQAARRWDTFTSKHLFMPVAKAVGGLLGIDQEALRKAAERQESETNWTERIENDAPKHPKR